MGEIKRIDVARRRQGSPLVYFLAFIFCLFIGILIFAYMVTKKTHPVYTDQQGNPTNAESSSQPTDSGKKK